MSTKLEQLQSGEEDVAICDDNPSHLMLLNRKLTKKLLISNTSIHGFENPDELMEAVRSNPKILNIICDLKMGAGFKNGFQVFEELMKIGYKGIFIIHSDTDPDRIEQMKIEFLSEPNLSKKIPIVDKNHLAEIEGCQIKKILESTQANT